MPSIRNPEAVESLISEGLRSFFEEVGCRPWRVVVWLEPENQQCGLFISTAEGERDVSPADFDYPSYATEEVLLDRCLFECICEGEADEESVADLCKELVKIVKTEAEATSVSEAPIVWGVRVGFDFYKTWDH